MLFTLYLLTACSTSTETKIASTAVPGISIAMNGVSFTIPEGLGTGASSTLTTGVEYPYINPSFGDMPSHTVLTLVGYPITDRSARILIFKADEYAAYTEQTAETIAGLVALPQQLAEPFPPALMPGFYVQARSFQAAHNQGLRYLTEVQTGVAPVSNDGLFYFYQGLSTDGIYFIEAIFPVHAAFLPVDSSPAGDVPADGIPFPYDSALNSPAIQDYFTSVKEKLNTATEDVFTPSLSILDELVASIQVTP